MDDSPEVQIARRLIDEASDNQREYAESWKRYQKVYEGENHPARRKGTSGTSSRLYVKHAYQQVETIKARLIEPDPEFNFEPIGADDNNYSRAIQSLVRYQLYRDRFISKQHAWAHDAMISGLAVAKVAWDSQTRKINTENGIEEIVTKSDPTVVRIPPEDFLWDPAATTLDDAAYVIHRLYLTKSTLQKRARDGIYQNVDYLIEKRAKAESETRSYNETDKEQNKRRNDRYEVCEIYHSDGSLTVVGERCTILRQVDRLYQHGQLPFAITNTNPLPNSIVGRSEVWAIEQIQDYVWAVENMRIDASKLAIDPPFKYRKNMKGGGKFSIEAGGRIGLDGMEDIQQLVVNPGSVFGAEEVQAALGYMQQMTGANVYLSGAESPMMGMNQTTATGVNLIQQESNMRMAMKLMRMHEFYARIADLVVKLDQEFVDEDRVVRILGTNERIRVPLDAIVAGWDVMPKWSSIQVNREQRRQSALELLGSLQAITNMPLADGRTVSLSPAVEKLVESHTDDPAKYLVPIENMVEAQMRAQPPQPQMPLGMDESQQQTQPVA